MADVAERDHLARAAWRASRGKTERAEVRAFLDDLEGEVARLRADLLGGEFTFEPLRSFEVHDPKRRRIEAPCFRERVLHHALVSALEPRVERCLVDDTFACRRAKGGLRAVRRAQAHLRRFETYVQVDVRAYYASIDHAVLEGLLARLFRDRPLLRLIARLLRAYAAEPGRGLPIGALSSQLFANLYLAPFDRFLEEAEPGRGFVRYMDDIVWWPRDRATVSLERARRFCAERLHLDLHRERIQQSARGLTFVGYRVHADHLGLTTRRRRRYRAARKRWEEAFEAGVVSARALQRGGESALAICTHTRSRAYRRRELLRREAPDA